MKPLRVLLISLVVFIHIGWAQAQIQWKGGGGFAFGTAVETVGLRLQADAQITEHWEALTNFIVYFKSVNSYWEANFDWHYDLLVTDEITVYPLIGFNISRMGFRSNLTLIRAFMITDQVGLNLGGGGEYAFTDQIAGLFEIKYILSNFDQLVISAGAVYSF